MTRDSVVATSLGHSRSSVRKPPAGLSILFGFLLLSALASAQTAQSSGCQPDEEVFYSCRLQGNGRVVSLCASPKAAPFTSITYRYGTETRNELTYSASAENHNQFLATVSTVNPKAAVDQVWLKLKDTRYIITACDGGDCPYRGGLIVFRGDKLLMSRACENDSSHPWFSPEVVDFESETESSHSKTDLIEMKDYDNRVQVLYPWKRVN